MLGYGNHNVYLYMEVDNLCFVVDYTYVVWQSYFYELDVEVQYDLC